MGTTVKLGSLSAIVFAIGTFGALVAEAQSNMPIQTAATSQSAQAPLSAQERLDAIRQSLVDASLQTPTRVTTTSWIDGNGSLRESSSFKNGMEVRGVRVLAYDRDESGQVKARLQNSNTNNLKPFGGAATQVNETGLKGAVQKINKLQAKISDFVKEINPLQDTTAPICASKVGARMNHLVSLELDIDPRTNAVLLQTLLPQLQTQWVNEVAPMGQASAWRVVNQLPAASMSNNMSAYERALIGNRPQTLPWHANLKVNSVSSSAPGLEGMLGYKGSHLVLNLDFQIVGTEGQREKFEESISLALEIDQPAWSAPRMSASSLAIIQDQLQTLRSNAEQWLSCHAITPTVTAVQAQQIQINAGYLSGVKRGDEWLIANPASFPGELVGKNGAPQTLLAKVQAVSPYNSQLVVLAGPIQALQADWKAWPTETLIKEPNIAPAKVSSSKPQKRNTQIGFATSASYEMSPY